jgi:N-acetylmuramoyl-L-alanine amidase
MSDPKSYHFRLPPYQGPPLSEPPNAVYPGIDPHVAACTSSRTLHGDGRVRAFVIHATAGYSSSGAMSVLFEHKASWHWLVPDEDEPHHGQLVWRCVPERRAAWHVRNDRSHPDVNSGSRYVNYWSIGVEVVNSQKNDEFSDWQVRQTAALVRHAWSRYPDLVDVVSHAKLDPGRRSDPGTAFPWDRFRDLVLQPAALVRAEVPEMVPALGPIQIIGPTGERIDCDSRLIDGVTMGEVRPLVESLGFHVTYEDGPPMTMHVHPGKARKAKRTGRARKARRPRSR